ncbi:flagellar hook-associated protein FlgK [Paracoccus albus]|uniref:flagellar hook-associated protein FlgK n=1 Tax=Paracoccus albus TaxID=3017784 RepID=UPI0022F13B91|nr:flagellar hook-associated protein FlgK [Paracoccus albus]WBU59998.1 flagellar hook-associated protein FlgK [Paracoccus albus]
MSIANALNNAISGLTAASRGTEVVSTNLANALTPGYARRELELSPRLLSANGGGVQVTRVTRIISESLLADLRLANASLAQSSTSFGFFKQIEAAIGQPLKGNSLSSYLAGLETTLISAGSRPDSDLRLEAVLDAAHQVSGKINDISASIQNARISADREIYLQVQEINSDPSQIAKLNRQIIVAEANGRDSASLADTRRAVIDRVSGKLPIQTIQRDNRQVAIYSKGGMVLLDGKEPTKLEFKAKEATAPKPEHPVPLARTVWLNGTPASPSDFSHLSGGSLSELFMIRDHHTVAAQNTLDNFATGLHDVFAAQSADPTIRPGGSGLFSDRRGNYSPNDHSGLAGNLRVNPLIDPGQGGDLWRIRNGVGAVSPGDVGDGTILQSLGRMLSGSQTETQNQHVQAPNLMEFAASLFSEISTARVTLEEKQAHDQSVNSSLQAALLTDGVDSDREMEMLLQLEKSYAANAKVIQIIDKMLDQILRV